jgi:hypothetical protein
MGELPRRKLSGAELLEALKSLPGWKVDHDKLTANISLMTS